MLAIVLWASTVALGRSLGEQIGAAPTAAAVFLAGAAEFALLGRLRHRPLFAWRDLDRRYLFVCGGLFVFYMFALFQAVALAADRLQVLEVGMLNYLWPVLTLVFSVRLLGHRANGWLLPGTGLAVLGEFLVLGQGGELGGRTLLTHLGTRPAVFGLAAAAGLSWALYSTLSRRWAGNRGPGAVPLFMLATGVLMLLVSLFLPPKGPWTPRALAEIAFLSLATVAAYGGWDAAMRKGDIVLVAAASYLTPLLSTLVSCAYLGILPGARLWIGCAVLVGGSLLSWRAVAPPAGE